MAEQEQQQRQQPTFIPEVKLVLLGNKGAGKKTLIHPWLTGERETRYMVDLWTHIIPLMIYTNRGPIVFNVWLVDDDEEILKNDELRAAIFRGTQCAIFMIDLTSQVSCQNVNAWNNEIWNLCGRIPSALFANKVDDVGHRQVGTITPARGYYIRVFELSAKSIHDSAKVFLWLTRKVVGDAHLYFVEAPYYEHQPHDFIFDIVRNSSLVCSRRNFTQNELEVLVMLQHRTHVHHMKACHFLMKQSQMIRNGTINNGDPYQCLARLSTQLTKCSICLGGFVASDLLCWQRS